jgi:Tol biopolymer transport system component
MAALAVVVLVAGAAAMPAGQADQAEVLMQAARNKQIVEGKLDEAIRIYQDVLSKHGQDRPVAARALAAIGQCYEKLGAAQTAEARKAYERLVQQYPEQRELVAQARARLAALAAPAGAAGSSTLTVRRVLDGDVSGKVSPDGRYVSLTEWPAGNLAIRDLASGEVRRLTETGGLAASGSYAESSVPSPDGRSVAYAWVHETYDLCVVGLDGSKPRVLRVSGNGVVRQFPLAWSPDGTHLLTEFINADGTRDMRLVAVLDGSARLLKALGKNPSPGGAFSPDGRHIAWATREGLSLFDLQTGAESPLIADQSNHGVLGWVPDGTHILFSSERSGSADAWLIAVADGKVKGEPVFVKKDWGFKPMGFTRSGAFYYAVNNNVGDIRIAEIDPASGMAVSRPRPASPRGNTWAPDWSRDGRYLAYILAREAHRTVIVRTLETGEEREFELGERTIGLGASLRWSPDGKALAVSAFEPGRGESLARLDVQTGRVSFLMPLPAGVGFPSFDYAPDGSRMFYKRPADPQGGHGPRLVVRDLTSGEEVTVVEKQSFFQAAPSPDGRSLVMAGGENGRFVYSIVPATGGDARELLRIDPEKEVPFGGCPWWSPDGRYVYFLKGVRGKTPGEWHLWRVAAEGGEPQPTGLTVDRQMGGLRMHPDGRRLATTDFGVNLEMWVMENFLPKASAVSNPRVE